jgi:hypothetical protein
VTLRLGCPNQREHDYLSYYLDQLLRRKKSPTSFLAGLYERNNADAPKCNRVRPCVKYSDYSATIFSACGPLSPCLTSNSTF